MHFKCGLMVFCINIAAFSLNHDEAGVYSFYFRRGYIKYGLRTEPVRSPLIMLRPPNASQSDAPSNMLADTPTTQTQHWAAKSPAPPAASLVLDQSNSPPAQHHPRPVSLSYSLLGGARWWTSSAFQVHWFHGVRLRVKLSDRGTSFIAELTYLNQTRPHPPHPLHPLYPATICLR